MFNVVLLTTALILAVLTALVTVGYLLFYRSRVNRRLKEPGENKPSRLWSPQRAALTAVIAALTVFAVIAFLSASHRPAARPDPSPAAYSAAIFPEEERQAGVFSGVSPEENAGYRREEVVLGTVRYTYFISAEGTDTLHPAFFLFAEYLGQGKPSYYDAIVTFSSPQGEEMASTMVSAGEPEKPVVFIAGNAFADCEISCVVEFYETPKEEYNPQVLQEENTPLRFFLPLL